MTGRVYTPAEDAYIRANWTREADHVIGKALGRSAKGVKQRRVLLGLRHFAGGNAYGEKVVAPAKPVGVSPETIAWAIANFHTNPEARVIAAMVAGGRS